MTEEQVVNEFDKWVDVDAKWSYCDIMDFARHIADMAVAEEREACAKECEREMMFEGGRQESFAHHGVQEAAKAIRARTTEVEL